MLEPSDNRAFTDFLNEIIHTSSSVLETSRNQNYFIHI